MMSQLLIWKWLFLSDACNLRITLHSICLFLICLQQELRIFGIKSQHRNHGTFKYFSQLHPRKKSASEGCKDRLANRNCFHCFALKLQNKQLLVHFLQPTIFYFFIIANLQRPQLFKKLHGCDSYLVIYLLKYLQVYT